MAFNLPVNNGSGVAIVDVPGGTLATNENFTTLYDYATQNSPELVKELYYTNGKGKLTGFLGAVGQKKTYASDTVQHMEIGRLHNKLRAVTFLGNVFTSPTPHNLRVGMVIEIADALGVKKQATVSVVTSTTVFTALNNATGAYGLTSPVNIVADFSNAFKPGSDPFDKGRIWNPSARINYTHILGETYEASNSKMTQKTWLQSANGSVKWANEEIERTNTLFDNLHENTHIFFTRLTDASAAASAGFAQGMKGIVQQIEQYGNVVNDYITTKADLDVLTYRMKQQNTGCREYTMHANHAQLVYLQTICATQNASFVNGTHWGSFSNDKEMALKLDFKSIYLNGITIHFSSLDILDDPTMYGDTNYAGSGINYILIPSGKTDVMRDGNTVSTPYISIYHRKLEGEDRERKVQIFGIAGTPQKGDKTTVNFWSETTNEIAGANAFFVGNKGAAHYS